MKIYTLSSEGRYRMRLKDGRSVFLKVSHSNRRRSMAYMRQLIEREKTCLEVLQGLAIPRLVRLSRRQLPTTCPRAYATFLAQTEEGEKTLDEAGFTPAELLGVWLFVAEQMVAFRKHQILYTDIKCTNLVVAKRPLRITVVDFNSAVPIVSGQKWIKILGYTPTFEPPELLSGRGVRECSLVYMLGMLLAHILTGLNNRILRHPKLGLSRTQKILRQIGAPGCAGLLARCLDPDAAKRPKDYAQLLKIASAMSLPMESRDMWKTLRAPYKERLAGLGLFL